MDYKEKAKELIDWFDGEENYSIVQYAANHGVGKKELFRWAGEDEGYAKALDYALTVMEFKATDAMLFGKMDKSVGMKLLETYCDWKADVTNVYQNVGGSLSSEAVDRLTEAIEGMRVDGRVVEDELPDGFGEVIVSAADFSLDGS